MGSRKPRTGDNLQVESGSDVDALRFNIPKGTSKVYEIVACRQLPTGIDWAIAAQVDKDDVDIDTCVVKGWTPEKGAKAEFTHTLNGEMLCRKA